MCGAVTRRRPLRVVVTDGRGRALRADRLRRWLAEVAPESARGELAVALVGDRKMRELNERYRGINRVTDVLAFPSASASAPDTAGGDGYRTAHDAGRHLGDIVIATGVARRQARAAGHRLGVELRCLALHGLLHLLGYDHERDTGQMARLERELRRQGGVA